MREHWNEIQFLSWSEFSRMAPSILRLEVRRIGSLLRWTEGDIEFHNALIRTRFSLKQFIDCIEGCERKEFSEQCIQHLAQAMMSIPAVKSDMEEDMTNTLTYIVDRLDYVYRRISLIY